MASSVTFDLLARDQASPAFTKLGRAAEDTGRKVGGLTRSFGAVTAGSRGLRTSFGLIGKGAALAAGAAGVGSLIAGFKGVYEEAREAQKVGAQTAAVIKSTGGVAHVSAAQVGDLATAISNKVGVDDEAIQSGANLLLTFKGIRNEAGKGNKIFDQATQVVTDMAAAMNQGTVTSDGLKTASIQVGKALNDPLKGITALTKVGVTFTDGQKKQIKTLVEHGKTLDAQKIILGELNSEFAGSAQAGTTASQKLGVVFGNIKETIGTALLPAIDAVSTWLANTLPGALKVASSIAGPIFKKLGDGLSGLASGFSGKGITADGFVGVMERIGKAGKVAVDFINSTIIPGFQGLASAFSGQGVTSDGFVGVMETIGDRARTALTWLQQTFLPGVVQVFKDLTAKVKENLPTIDLSGLATSFKEQATKWGGAIIDGVKTGLSTGDWSGLGDTIGKGVVSAISAAGSFVKTIATKIGDLLSKVDWVGIGLAIGKQVPSLLVGLAAGILNFDLMGLLKGLAKHWQDVLFAIIAVAFTPAKIIGKVAEVLSHIPLVGRLLAWALEHFAAFSKGLVRMVGDALGFMGKAFLEGFRRVFPGIGEGFLTHLRNLPTYIAGVTLEVIGKAKLMMARLAGAISGGIAGVVAKIGELIGKMLRPFADAGGWLVRRGVEFVSGLARGVVGALGSVARAAGRVISAATVPFRAAGSWLVGHGRDLVVGLLNGAKGALSGVGQWIKDVGSKIVGAVKSFFGIRSPSTVFAELGKHMITGLIKGMADQNPTALVTKVFGGMTGALRSLFNKGLLGSAAGLPAKALDALGMSLGSPAGGFVPDVRPGSVQSMVKGYAQALYGWSGQQWDALYKLLMRESGFNPNAQNPTSTAYGIFQFLNSTWGTVNAVKTSNPNMQTLAGLRYIRAAYGDPLAAWGHEQIFGWYGAGMPPTVFSKPTLIGVGERGPETVSVTPQRMVQPGGPGRSLRQELEGMEIRLREPSGHTLVGRLVLAGQAGSR